MARKAAKAAAKREAKPAAVRGRGRPPVRPNPFAPGILDAICRRLIGGESMVRICKDPRMPSKTDVYVAIADNEDFRTRIARARECQQDAFADDIMEEAYKATIDNLPLVQFRVRTKQWHIEKLAPLKYGKRVDHGFTPDAKTQVQTWLSELGKSAIPVRPDPPAGKDGQR